MSRALTRQKGFALIVSMLVLLVLTILVVNAVRNTSLNEKMAGNYMDRTRAQQAAEQALRQGEAALANDLCSSSTGCRVSSLSPVTVAIASVAAATTVPASWTSAGALDVVLYDASNSIKQQLSSAQLNVTLLADTFLPTGKAGCKPYSLMGRGVGLDTRAVVVLQTVAFVCDF